MSENAGAGQGDAPPEESQGEKGERKGKTIPIEAFNAALNNLKGELKREREARTAAEERFTAAQQRAAEPKPLTRAQLNAAVNEGQITQEAADAAWERQVIETASHAARSEAGKVSDQKAHEAMINAELAQFQSLVPGAWEEGNRDRERVAREYAALTKLGLPPSKATELAALRAAFGDPDAIRRSRSMGRSGTETFQETGGAGVRGGDEGGDKHGPPRGIRPEQKARYERLIQAGQYADWNAVKAELKFARARRA